MVKANADITWAPPEVGAGRFGNWLAGNIDWSLSRNRFWGTPLNVWICDECGELHLPICRDELSKLTGKDQKDLDLHKPHVDGITFGCVKDGCAGTMNRTPEVIDCWFDAGSMPFAQYHWPFENQELFESQYPADFISEGIDQTRGWFYTMLVISTFLTGRSSYKRCLVNELILDNKGKKMSKSVGNTVDPMAIMRESGADPLRWYMLTVNPVWIPTKFDQSGVAEARSKLLGTLENTYKFFSLYANLDGWTPDNPEAMEPELLDRWILSRLQSVAQSVRHDLEAMNLTRAGKTLGAFVLDDVSNWYVRLSRKRFWHGEMTTDKNTAYTTLYTVLETVLRLLAPFMPFTSEEIYRNLCAQGDESLSVHLQTFPEADSQLQDVDLEARMKAAQDVVSLGRNARQQSGMKTRQPLRTLLLHSQDPVARKLVDDPVITAYILAELNLKEIGTTDDLQSVARPAAKANFRVLGQRFGKSMKKWAAVVNKLTGPEIVQYQQDGQLTLSLEGQEEIFSGDDIQVSLDGVAPYVVAGAGNLVTALDTTLDDELRSEGMAREIINKIQNLRKKSGLEVSDRITVTVAGPEPIQAAMQAHTERICTETLAESLAADGDQPFSDTFRIEDSEVTITLAKI